MNKEVIILSIDGVEEQLIEQVAQTLGKAAPEHHWIIVSKKIESIDKEQLRELLSK